MTRSGRWVGVVGQAIRVEFQTWEAERPGSPGADFPHPEDPGGLPDGWRLRAAVKHGRLSTRYLVSRDAGGWIVVEHFLSDAKSVRNYTMVPEHAPSLEVLYDRVRHLVNNSPEHGLVWDPAEEMIRTFICAAYDVDDPTEAAERLLVALGNRPTFMPPALT